MAVVLWICKHCTCIERCKWSSSSLIVNSLWDLRFLAPTGWRVSGKRGVGVGARGLSLFKDPNPNPNPNPTPRFTDTHPKVSTTVDCKTVGFFLKISKEIGKAWRKSLKRETREPLALCFQPRSRPFVWLLACTWIRKNTDRIAVDDHGENSRRLGSD